MVLRFLAFETCMGAIVFLSAGTVRLPWVWAFLVTHFAGVLAGISRLDSGLKEERLKPGRGEDRLFRAMIIPFLVGQLVVAGLDVGRFHWSDAFSIYEHLMGAILLVSGLYLSMSAARTNRFFSPVVRIQEERGHHLVDTGPYRQIRHPGYAGTIQGALGASLFIGSWWSLALLLPCMMLIIRRLLNEEAFLTEKLPGYAEYRSRTRYRLIPGIW